MNARPISVWRAVPGDDDHLSSGVDAVNLKPALGKIETIVVIGLAGRGAGAVHPIKNAAWNTDYLVKLLPLFCNAITLGSAGSVLT